MQIRASSRVAGDTSYTLVRRYAQVSSASRNRTVMRHDILGRQQYIVCFPKMSHAYMALDLARRGGVRSSVTSNRDKTKTRVLLCKHEDAVETGEIFVVRFEEVRAHAKGIEDVGIVLAHTLLNFDEDRMTFDASLVEAIA